MYYKLSYSMNKTLYFDIETSVHLKTLSKKSKRTESAVARHAIKRLTYADLHKELVEDMKYAKFISRKNLLK
jgi:hypothetical protein